MLVVAIDLEMNQPSNKIIELGYTIGDLGTGEVKLKKGIIVNCGEILNPDIIKLTHITQEMVDMGVSVDQAYSEFIQDCQSLQVHRQPVVWGGGDARTLKQQVWEADKSKLLSPNWSLGHTEMNIKNVVQAILGAHNAKTQGGLSRSMGKFGCRFQGVKHRAIDDSYNTFVLYLELLNRLKSVTVNIPVHAKGE